MKCPTHLKQRNFPQIVLKKNTLYKKQNKLYGTTSAGREVWSINRPSIVHHLFLAKKG